MAYSAPTAHRAVSSETLMLQVRFALPPSAHRTSSSSCSGVPHGLFMISHHRPCGRWCFARLIRQAEMLELQLHSQPPSKRTALSPPKRSCFRFASLALRWAGEASLPPAPLSPAPGNAETDRRQSPSAGKALFRSTPWISLPLCISPRRLGPSCARRPDRRQNVQHPLAPQHPCRPRPLLFSYRSFFFSYFS